MAFYSSFADMRTQPSKIVYFAIPGDINSCTGGYAYDRRLITGLREFGFDVRLLQLSAQFPTPDDAALMEADAQISALPDGASLIIDGLAWGVMNEIANKHKYRLRLIALCHHPLMLETGLSPAQQQSLQHSERIALQACTAVIVTSEQTRRLLIDHFTIDALKIYVALPGTDHQEFAPCIGNPPQLLTLATLTRRKGHDVLVEALAKIAHLPWHARFVGGDHFDPQWTKMLYDKIAALGLSERIVCTGTVVDVRNEFLRADVFVLPSHFEGYGMAFAEALAYGLPIVATNTSAIPSVVPSSAGILVAPNDANALANALADLLTNTTKRSTLQQGARTTALTLPQWDDTASVVARIINQHDV